MTIQTIGHALEVWSENLHQEKRYNRRHKSLLKSLNSHFGSFNISKITHDDIKSYIKKREVKEQTVEKELSVLKGAISFCHKAELIDNPPSIRFNRAKPKYRERFFSKEEVRAILNTKVCNSNPKFKLLLKIAITTCARKSAIRTLRTSQINFDANLIDFNHHTMHIKSKPRAIIPIPSSIKDELRKACDESKNGFVVYFHEHTLDSLWEKAFDQANINGDPKKETAVFHTLRHTGAVEMAKSGKVSMKEISSYLGHSSIIITEKVYAKYLPSFMRDSVNVMNGLLGEST